MSASAKVSVAASLLVYSAICSFAPGKAQAQKLGDGSWSLGVERLYGVTYTADTVHAPGGKVKTSAVNYSFFSNPASSQRTVYSSPRLVADYLITDEWSAGLGAGIVGGSTKIKSDAGELEGASVFGLVLAPRAGYLLMQNNWFAFWPKAGVTYTTSSASTDNATAKQYRGALSLEASALVLLGPSAVLSFTPMFDLGVIGSNSAGSGDSLRATALEFGLQGGLGLRF